MSYEFCDKLKEFKPYTAETGGGFKIKMDANESFVSPNEEFSAVVKEAAASVDLSRYPDPLCSELCSAFAGAYGSEGKYITAGNGSDELISLICGGFMQSGEKAMVITPDFLMYEFYLKLYGCEVVRYEKNDDFTFDVDDMISSCKKQGCRMLIFSNPCNPTSIGLDRGTVRKIITGLENVLVVVDEAYMDFWDQSLIGEIARYDNAILLRTCSKMMGLAALRVGFAVANEKITGILRSIKSPYNVGGVSQAIATAVISHNELLERARRKITVSRNELYLLMNDLSLSKNIKVFETRTNFVTVRMENAKQVYEGLRSESILTRCFDGYLRITACKKAQNRALFEAMMRLCK